MTKQKASPPGIRGTDRSSRPLAPPPPLAGEGREGAPPHEKSIGEGPEKLHWRVQPKMRVRARTLRHEQTKAERIIWYAVRAHRLDGVSFRRQVPIGPYIVDFLSYAARLIVEIDGGQHFANAQQVRDNRRDTYLRSKGYRVLRFTNLEVISNRDGVVSTIAAAVPGAQTPSLPSPASEGGGASGTGGVSQQ